MNLILPFLGSRNYLQGTTLLNALLSHLPQPDSFTFKIRHIIFSNQVEISKTATGDCQAILATPHACLFVKAMPQVEPLHREAFDENAINAALSPMHNDFCLASSPYLLIPSLISAFKHILVSSYPAPAGKGNFHWAFIGLQAHKWRGNNFSPLSITGISCKNGLARCESEAQNGFNAILYFAWVDFGAQK